MLPSYAANKYLRITQKYVYIERSVNKKNRIKLTNLHRDLSRKSIQIKNWLELKQLQGVSKQRLNQNFQVIFGWFLGTPVQ